MEGDHEVSTGSGYKQPVSKSSGTKHTEMSHAGSKKVSVHHVVSGEEGVSSTTHSFARRRNKVAQRYLSSKDILTTASSDDLESVDALKAITKAAPATTSASGYNNAADAGSSYDEPGRIRTACPPDARPMRAISNHSNAKSPKSSRFSQTEEKKKIQKVRNRMKGKNDNLSCVSADSQSTFSQGS